MQNTNIDESAFDQLITKTIELMKMHQIDVQRDGLNIEFGEKDRRTITAFGTNSKELAEDLYIKLTQAKVIDKKVREMRLNLEQTFRPLRESLSERVKELFSD